MNTNAFSPQPVGDSQLVSRSEVETIPEGRIQEANCDYLQGRITRAEALQNGSLLDITSACGGGVFRIRSAVSHTLWHELARGAPFAPHHPCVRKLCRAFVKAIWKDKVLDGPEGLTSRTFFFDVFCTAQPTFVQALWHQDDNGAPVITLLSAIERALFQA